MPFTNAARYEPVRSKIAPDIQPPSAMPNSVAISTVPTRAPASARREVLAHDDRVRRHDAALEQAEQRRRRRRATPARRTAGTAAAPCPAAPSRAAACAGRRCGRRSRPRRAGSRCRSASISDSISRAARRAVAEIAAVRDDVHLRHRHRDAARDARDAQQRLQRVRRQAERTRGDPRAARVPRRAGSGACERRPAAQQQRERQHRDEAEDADADVRVAPAGGVDEMLRRSAARRRPRGSCRSRRSRPRCRAGARTTATCRRRAARTSPSCRASRSARPARA